MSLFKMTQTFSGSDLTQSFHIRPCLHIIMLREFSAIEIERHIIFISPHQIFIVETIHYAIFKGLYSFLTWRLRVETVHAEHQVPFLHEPNTIDTAPVN